MGNHKQLLDWRADEEDGWEEIGATPAGPSPRFQRWLWLSSLLLLALASLWAVGRLRQQVTTATHNAESDVLAAHNLLLQAILERNEDFFTPALSHSDSQWWRDQQGLFAEGLLLDRFEWGFPLADLPPAGTQVTLSPDLQQAQVTFTLRYDFAIDRTFELFHTFTYRLEAGRWLLIRPEEPFWGPWITRELTHFTLVYPTRDQVLGDRLGNDLQNTLNEVCRLIACSPSVQIQLRLEPLIGTLAQAGSPMNFMGRTTISLPAPSLWGQPLDEMGYQLLLQSYATQFISFLLSYQQNGYAVPDSLTEATIQRTLVELGLLTWPPLAHSGNAQLPPALANHSVYLLCAEDEQQMGLYRFNFGSQVSHKLYSDPHLLGMTPVVGDEGLFLYRQNGSITEMWYYRPGQSPILVPNARDVFSNSDWGLTRPVIGYEVAGQFSFALFDPAACTPAGCQMVLLPQQIPLPSPQGSRVLLYDLANNQIALNDPAGGPPIPVASGYQPFWIDEKSFGFLQFEGRKSFDAPSQLLLADLESGQITTIIDKNHLIRIGLEDGLPLENSFLLTDVMVNPLNPNILLITVAFFQDQNMSAPIFQWSLYRYELDSGRLELVKWFNDSEMESFALAPNGQWLTSRQQRQLEVYQLENNDEPILSLPFSGQTASEVDWLAGEDWFLFLSNGLLTLANPAEKSHYLLPVPAGCAQALWVR